MIGRDSVAGSPDGSSEGTTMCAVMIASMPASIAAWNGGPVDLPPTPRGCG